MHIRFRRRSQTARPTTKASEQDVRNAALAALRVSKVSLIMTSCISLVSVYLSVAAGKHLWPWADDPALNAAKLVTAYETASVPSNMGPNTQKTTITIVNNAGSPARQIYLTIPVSRTVNHAAISPKSAVN